MLLILWGVLSAHPEDAWDERIDPACCPYPEHDPRDYNWCTPQPAARMRATEAQ